MPPSMSRREALRTTAIASTSALGAAFVTRANTQSADAAALGSSVAQQAVQGHQSVWWSAPAGTTKQLALNFDDGPTGQFTAQVLDVLREHKVRASFFVIGALVERYPELVRRARDEGHEIANHSYDHISSVRLTAEQVRASVARGADAVDKVLGARPRWFRPPRGEITSATLLAAMAEEQEIALWSLVRNGADGGAADDDAPGVLRHLKAAIHPGAVIDLHDGIGQSAWVGLPDSSLLTRRRTEISVLPQAITAWLEAGYEFVTISELIPPS